MSDLIEPTGFQAPPGLELDERITIGSALDDKGPPPVAELAAIVKAEQFYKPAHQIIWAAVERLLAESKPVDPASVMEELRRVGDLTKMGAGPYLATCLGYSSWASAAYHAEKVVADWRRRSVWMAAVRVMQRTGDFSFDYESGFDWCRDQMDEALASTEGDATTDLEALTWEVLADLESGAEPAGLTTGLLDLDKAITRLRPGQLIFVGARPATGKTIVGLNFAAHAALTLRKPTHFHTLEMSREEVILRLLSAEARVDLSRLLNRDLDDRDWGQLGRARQRISGAPLKIFDRASTGLAEVRGELSVARRRNPVGLVVVDYLQLMAAPKRNNREQEIAALSRGLKLLAKEYEVPVVALTQLNRGPEHRTSGRPAISDLRESGTQEQDADVVILLHREEMYDRDSPRSGEMDLIVAKQRNGPTGTVTVAFQGRYARCMDLAHDWTPSDVLGRSA